MNEPPATTRSRLAAFAVDWSVVVLWGGALFAVVTLASGGRPPRPAGPWVGQAIGLLSMTLPVTLYFALCESCRWQASIGKRVVGLRVCDVSGDRLSFRRSLLRSGIKFVPWECGHLLAQQAALGSAETFPAWLWAPAAVAFVTPLWWAAVLLRRGETPYDRWSGARVVRGAAALSTSSEEADASAA